MNGNGRTARAACYYVLCAKLGFWLPGQTSLPELIRANRDEYVRALKAADAARERGEGAAVGLKTLYDLLQRLLKEQLATAPPPPAQPPAQH